MKKSLLAMACALAATSFSYGQHKCGSDHIHKNLIQSQPQYLQTIQANESQIQRIIQRQKASKTTETVYKVPVVVHVIHTGTAVGVGSNISDALVQAGIDSLNRAFRNQHGQSVDVKIEFELAKQDENCNSTNGIIRIDGSVLTDYATHGVRRNGANGPTDAEIKALSRWPNTEYYNIWIVSEFDDNNGGFGLQGYAYFPGASAAVDGTTIMANAYTGSAKTLIHEIGHAFNLYHTFEGDNDGASCPTGNQCGSDLGDCCGDTPPHIRSGSNCNTGGTNSCDGNSSNTLFVHNYMDYSSDACQYLFTTEQKARMRAALEGPRSSLLTSTALNSTLTGYSLTAATCTGTTGSNNNSIGTARVQIIGKMDISSGAASSSSGYYNRTGSCENLVELDLDSTYTFSTTIMTNAGNQHMVRAWIDYNDNGTFDASESIFYDPNIVSGSPTQTAQFTVPSNANTTKYLRMRVFADFQNNLGSITDACQANVHGETEDYIVKIKSSATAPVADFSANKTTVCVGEGVTFNDASTNTPTSWSWSFTGGNPSTSSSQNQAVVYNTPGTYTVTLTATNAAGSDPETKTNYITVVANPTVNLGADQNICTGANASLDAGNGGSTFLWSTGATTQTINPSTAGSFNVTVTNGNGCTGTDTAEVTIHALPTVSVNDAAICNGDAAATFTATAPTATGFSWSGNGSGTNQTTQGTTAGDYIVQVTDGNGCTNVDTGALTVNALPTVSLGADQVICAGQNASLDAGNGGASFLWNTGATTQTISPSSAGSYNVTVTDGNGCVGRDTADVSVNALPAVSVNDAAICSGDAAATFTAMAPAAISYQWSGNGTGTNPTTTGTTAGDYIVVITDGNGCTATDTGALTVNAVPNVSLGADQNICQGASASLDAGNGGATFLWSTGATTQIISPTTAGSFNVAVTDGNGCIGRDTANVSVHALPSVSVNDNAICAGDAAATFTATAATATAYLWSGNGSGTNQTTSGTAGGDYIVQVTDANGCTNVDTGSLTVNAIPTVALGADQAICSGASASLDAGNSGATFLWSTGATTQSINASSAGSYNVTVTDGNGCIGRDTADVSIHAAPSVTVNDAAACSGSAATTFAANAPTAVSYLWSGNGTGTNQTTSGTTAGDYIVTVTDGNGCTNSDTGSLTVHQLPAVSVNDATICAGDAAATFTATAPTAVSYVWSDNGTGTAQTTSGTAAGDYTVVVTDANGCSQIDTGRLTVNALPTVDLGADKQICTGNNTTFDAGNGGATFLWSTGATTQSIVASTAGSFNVTVTDGNGCIGRDTVVLSIGSAPSVNLGVDTTICSGSSLNLDAGAGFASYLWNTAASTQTISVTSSGTFDVTVNNGPGCIGRDTIVVTVANNPTVALGNDTTLCSGSSLTLDAGNASSYLWNTGATTQTISASSAGTYHVAVTDANNCSGTDTIVVSLTNVPVVSLLDTNICNGDTITLDAGNPGSTYSWNTGATTQTIQAFGTGLFHVTVSSGGNCSATDSMNLGSLAIPTVSVNDSAICDGSAPATFTATAPTAVSYVWSGLGTGTAQTTTGNSAGDYFVTITDAQGCKNTASGVLTVHAVPTVNLGGSQSICSGASINLDAGNAGSTITWSTGANTQVITVSTAGTYFVDVTNANNCHQSDTAVVSLASNPVVNLGSDTTVCPGSAVVLNAGSGFTTYLWSDGGTNSTSIASSAGSFHVTVTDGNGCSGADTIVVGHHTAPTVTVDAGFTTDYDVNQGDVTLTFGQPSGGVYTGPGVTGGVFNTTSAGVGSHQISYSFTDGNGCSGTADTTLVVSTTTGVADIDESSVSVFPNPYKDAFNVKVNFGSVAQDVIWTITDMKGSVIASGSFAAQGETLKTFEIQGDNSSSARVLTLRSQTEVVNIPLRRIR